jgi:DNA invertase Pin-like site-specific DNA recombinase
MATYYYMRVSTKQQSLARQEDAAKAADIPKQNWYCDKSTGRKISRDSLNALLDKAQEGDTIIVHSFDRLSRSTKDLLNTIDTLNERGIKLVSETVGRKTFI